jgi:hypothetical protein
VEALEERTLMNARFVVPAGVADNVTKFSTLQAALTTPGLSAGDVIQIEPNSSPGHIHNADIPAFQNLTIQGDAAFEVQSIPYFFLDDTVIITNAQQGFTLKNVEFDTYKGGLDLAADGTITGARITNELPLQWAVLLQATTAAVISNSYFENDNALMVGSLLKVLDPPAGSHNLITDNQLVALTGQSIALLNYQGPTGWQDVVAHNTFFDNAGVEVLVQGASGLKLQANTFTSNVPGTAIEVDPTVKFLQIADNVISLPHGDTGITVTSGLPIKNTNILITNNHINTGGGGIGIQFYGEAPGFNLNAQVEGNDLRGNDTGVNIYPGSGGSVAGIDLGGGSFSSLGGNDFRGDTTAISVYALTAAGPIQAQANIFGVADPTTVISDHHNDPTKAAVVATSPLTGNAAYVDTLYLDFLHRTGDVNNTSDAGAWVNLMGQGMPAATVANAIARSPEALGVDVDGLYHRFLGRDADPAGRAGFVAYLENGGTLEGVRQAMLASPEYQSHFPTGSSFVQSLYQNLLHRTGNSAEVGPWVALLPQLGRAGVAQGFLFSQECRDWEVGDDYAKLLHRTPSTSEFNAWVGSGLDLLTMDALFAGSQEYHMNG